MRLRLIVLLALLVCAALPISAAINDPVKVESGLVSGIPGSNPSVTVFKGIPYAAPPVGDNRWRDPQPVKPWDGVLKADHFSDRCIQTPAPQNFGMFTVEFSDDQSPMSENCLYLNIWTPAHSTGDKLPVFFWMHGGGLGSGAGSIAVYDGEGMAEKGVVFVNINYRLGPLGFLAHPELTAESPHHSSGNYGHLDQLAALKWVHDNIAAFGGDPDKVTIAGQSAGAGSTISMLVSPLTVGLFRSAIVESALGVGGGMRFPGPKTLADAEKSGTDFMKTKGANTLAQMRAIPAEDLIKDSKSGAGIAGFSFGTILDGYYQTTSTAEAVASGKNHIVPILAGWNVEDTPLPNMSPYSLDQYLADAKKNYGDDADAFLKAFPAADEDQAKRNNKISARAGTGSGFHTWARLQAQAGHGDAKMYGYIFSKSPAYEPGEVNFGAFHTAEIPYAFNVLNKWNLNWKDADWKLADMMSSYWTNFVKTGDPNGVGLPVWHPYDPNTELMMNLGDQVGPVPYPDLVGVKFFEDRFLNKFNQKQ